ncbi:hypothetical protein DS891_07080 [Pseudoalteromonas sp. JC28]|uniref:hypothetical protein n=1 Tax=Pseudoalteromonas sp. JC28 TaxID=2267617 RepID=UPI001572CC0F|nr:hypothetical protein [Pseudoalteromonas sp. JC28]NSY33361.1 hypothetical protein [Pseudoalteromonas sp. JC28]
MNRQELYNTIYTHFTTRIAFQDKKKIVNDILELFNTGLNYHALDCIGSIEEITRQLVNIIQPKEKNVDQYLIG